LKRLISLGLSHPPRRIFESAGYVDVFEGFLGALVPAVAFDDRVFDIPEAAWTMYGCPQWPQRKGPAYGLTQNQDRSSATPTEINSMLLPRTPRTVSVGVKLK
jgi:hypothetical protein